MNVFGAPDIVIANAGVSAGTLTECEEDLAVFRRVMDINNVFGMAATFAPFIPAMRAAGGERRLAGIASVAGIRGLPGPRPIRPQGCRHAYPGESLRLEMRPYGIPVVTIAPGYIFETPMTAINPYSVADAVPAAGRQSFTPPASPGHRARHQLILVPVIPWPMGVVAKLLRLLPNWLYDRLFSVRRGSRAAC